MSPWTCFARPASTGRTCYHLNPDELFYGQSHGKRPVVCRCCGSTKIASDSRLSSGDVDRKVPALPVSHHALVPGKLVADLGLVLAPIPEDDAS